MSMPRIANRISKGYSASNTLIFFSFVFALFGYFYSSKKLKSFLRDNEVHCNKIIENKQKF